jgi:putative aldouronate transport system permease protein
MRRTAGERVFDALNIVLMVVLALVCLYPIIHVLLSSFSDPAALMAHEGPVIRVIGAPTLMGYKITLNNRSIGIGFRNTLGYLIIGSAMNVLLTSLAAYVLTRKYFALRKFMAKAMVLTMYFSGGIIPLFIVVTTIGIYDSPLAVLLPTAISTYNVIIMRSFFQNIPESMEESAIIDGAGDWTIYARIIMPLSKAVIAVITLYYAVGHWNSWFNAMIFLRDRNQYPLQLFLREILILNNAANEASSDFVELSMARDLVKYCTIIVSTVPILLVYPFAQRYFVQGVMIGAVKG